MLKVGLISDTHHYLDPQVFDYFDRCDELWHAGDFGNIDIARQLEELAPLVGVYGNIDGQDIRAEYPQNQRLERGGLQILMTHIGGTPGRYALPVREEIETNPPDLFVCGHSHILKIVRDPEQEHMIYMNPGAAGRQGFQQYRTVVRFAIRDAGLHDVEVITLGTKSD